MRRVGPYELVRRLGSGGMAEVWMARRELHGASKTVALKLLASHHAGKPVYRQMFTDEARLSTLLSHSNIVQVFDVGEAESTSYMAMEWVDGLNLAALGERLRQRGERLSDLIIAYIVGEVLRALAYAHELRHHGEGLGVVHRDISPQNVMLSVSGEVKVMDFGIARYALVDDSSGTHVKGKLRYMPPEQLGGGSRGPGIDLFAVGALLHELLDGAKFRGRARDEAELYGMILNGHVPALERRGPAVPAQLDQLRLGLLATPVERRIPSARAALGVLASWPGYRSAGLELEGLVRRCVGAEAPRTDLRSGTVVTQPPFAAEEREGSQTDLGRPPEQTGSFDSEHSRPSGPPVSATDLDRAAALAASRRAAAGPARRRSPAPLWVLAGLSALCAAAFGVFGVGLVAGWWSLTQPAVAAEPEAASRELAAGDHSTPQPDPNAQGPDQGPGAPGLVEIPSPTPTPDQPEAPTATPPDPNPDPDAAAKREASSAPPTQPSGAADKSTSKRRTKAETRFKPSKPSTKQVEQAEPVELVLLAPDYEQVSLRVGQRQANLPGSGRLSVPPGSHPVAMRVGEDGSWRALGKVEVAADKRYRLVLLKPAFIKLQEI